MTKINLILFVFVFFCSSALVNAQQVRVNRIRADEVFTETGKGLYLPQYRGPGILLQKDFVFGPNYIIGPEYLVTSGFYDWQSNGACMHQIAWVSNVIMHAVYMNNNDSIGPFPDAPLRRERYYFSEDGGANWVEASDLPTGNVRSGFGTLTVGTVGVTQDVAIVGDHYVSGVLTTGMHVDILPGGGTFTSSPWTFFHTNFIWPGISTLTNGNILIGANTYHGTAATDTGVTIVFNPVANSWDTSTFETFVSSASVQTNMRWTTAAGPNGKGIYVLDPIQDAGGSFGGARIFYYTTADNGTTWSNQNLLFDPFIDEYGDTSLSWLAIDAVYDNTGNFYITFNTRADSFQASCLWVSKNGATPVRVVRLSEIPGHLETVVTEQQNMIGLDWPSICVSDDGQYIFVAYTVFKQDDTLNGFNAADIYYSFSQTGTLNFQGNGPIQVTSGIIDERYPSLHRKALTQGNDTYVLHLAYQKDPQGGSFAFFGNLPPAPVSRAALIYRKITQAQVIGVEDPGSVAREYSMGQNYPNPFNPTTKIDYSLPYSGFVTLKIFDILGREVKTLVNEVQIAGKKVVELDASNLPSGVYFYTIKITDRSGSGKNFTDTKKMVLMK